MARPRTVSQSAARLPPATTRRDWRDGAPEWSRCSTARAARAIRATGAAVTCGGSRKPRSMCSLTGSADPPRKRGSIIPRHPDAPRTRLSPGRLRDHWPARRGRDGRGVAGSRREPRPQGRPQAPPARPDPPIPFGSRASSRRLVRHRRSATRTSATSTRSVGRATGSTTSPWSWSRGKRSGTRLQTSRVSVNDALHIAIQTSAALSVAHAAGIVHRDVKPENVCFSSRPTVSRECCGHLKGWNRGGQSRRLTASIWRFTWERVRSTRGC